MHIAQKGSRAVTDLSVAFGVGLLLVFLNSAINYIEALHGFFRIYSRIFVTDWLVNFLFFWLAILLCLAFRRWREATRRTAELENVISSISPDTLLTVRPDRSIDMCNDSVKRTFGYSPREIIGKKTDLLYQDRRRNKDFHPREVYEALRRDGFHIGTATGVRKGGETFPLEIIAGDLSGRTGAVLLLRDVTERIEADRRHHELEMRIHQRQKLESLGMLAGGIAHDFNNLLTVVLGNGELAMLENRDKKDINQNIDAIMSAARQAAGLCNQMLAYSGRGKLVVEKVDLSQVVRDTVKMLEVSIARTAKLEFRLSDEAPCIDGDIVQIQQIVMNLVINAADAIGEQDGTISVATSVRECDEEYLSQCAIDARLTPGRYVCLEVRDTGCGMDEETRLRIFDPFFTTKKTGRGLGLASVFGIIRGHHGALRVRSEEGQGTVFTALFPCGI